MGPGNIVTELSLGTDAVQGNNPTTEPREFLIGSLDAGDASTWFRILGLTFQQTTGTATITSVTVTVPEPSSCTMAAVGLLFVAGRVWSRRRMSPQA